MSRGRDTGAAVALDHAGRRVLLKWHKLRRRAGEPPFDPANLATGLAAGASLEVDIRCLADDSWICLHDATLDAETDGSGPVAALDRAAAARLRVTGGDFAPPLLVDLAAMVAGCGETCACLQLDMKEPDLSDVRIAALAAALDGIVPLCILSGYDWAVLSRVGAAIPGLRLGYDPYEVAETRTLDSAADFADFTEEVLATAPTAAVYYLYHRFVSAALDRGVNPIAMLQARGAKIDVWTLDPSMQGFAATLARMVGAGADQVTTNDAEAVARLWLERGA